MTRRVCLLCEEGEPAAVVQVHICREHLSLLRGMTPVENHHPEGASNSHDTIPVPTNAHAVITRKMTSWPEALREPSLDPLIQVARRELALQNFLEWYLRASRRDAAWLLALARHEQQHGLEWWKDLDIASLSPEVQHD